MQKWWYNSLFSNSKAPSTRRRLQTQTLVNAYFYLRPHEGDHRLRSVFTRPHENARKRIKRCLWTSCSVENIRKVFRLQKRAARVILGVETKANRVELFKQLGWVPFYHEARINKLILVYKLIFGGAHLILPRCLLET